MKNIFIVLMLLLLLAGPVFAGVFSKNKPTAGENPQVQENQAEEIQVSDSIDKLISKRQKEARELIAEGDKLIKKGQKKNKKNLITKGQIKKEIGEKQLELLNDQSEEKRAEDANYDW